MGGRGVSGVRDAFCKCYEALANESDYQEICKALRRSLGK
jgi:hypothetical protein